MNDNKTITNEIVLKEIEVAKLDLKPTDILFFKIISEELGEADFNGFARSLQARFPNNKVMVTMMYPGTDMEIYTISSESKPAPAVDCSVPTSFCNDCACGKKERILAENSQTNSAEGAENEYDVTEPTMDMIAELDAATSKDFNEIMKELEQKGTPNASEPTDKK